MAIGCLKILSRSKACGTNNRQYEPSRLPNAEEGGERFSPWTIRIRQSQPKPRERYEEGPV